MWFPTVGSGNGVAALLPVEVAFNVGLVHAVKSVMVEHGIHLGLARHVRGAHEVNIGLLHHGHIAQHGGHIDRTAAHGVRVLCVDAAEIGAHTIDIYLSVCALHLAEAMLGGKGHFLGCAIGCQLRHLDGVEVGVF